ncbi:MAG: hypothetical protein WBX19_20540 [Terracidiphilus sp.]
MKSPTRGAVLLLVAFATETTAVGIPPLPIGLNVYVLDIACAVLFIAASLRYAERKVKINKARAAVLAINLFFLVATVRGVAAFGVKDAGLASRSLFYVYASLLYFSSFRIREKQQREIVRVWLWIAAYLVGLALFRWVATALGLAIAASWMDAETSMMRVLNAQETGFLCFAFFFCLVLVSHGKATLLERVLMYVLPPVIILLQHRTVWLLFIVGVLQMSGRARQIRKLILSLLVVLLAALVISLSLFKFVDLREMLIDSATNSDTMMWRVGGWYQLVMNRNATVMDYLVGQPAGSDMTRVIGRNVVDANPHNFYVQTYLCQGLVGLGILLWLFFSRIRHARRPLRSIQGRTCRRRSYIPQRMWPVFLVAMMLFSLTYPLHHTQAVLLGMAVAIMPETAKVRVKQVRRLVPTVRPASEPA